MSEPSSPNPQIPRENKGAIYPLPTREEERRTSRTLLISMAIIIAATAVIAIIGFLFLNRPDDLLEGQVDGSSVRVSGKLAGRVAEIYVSEGDTVKAGDTLVHIHSSLVESQLRQSEAMQQAAQATNSKVDAGTRSQVIQSARDLMTQAEAAVTIARKTYDRVNRLYQEGVTTAQKRDEAKAALDAAVAGHAAARSQYQLALSGAQSQDKEAARAMVRAAGGGVGMVEAVLEDSYLVAPCDGTIDEIFPETGELIATGSPVMNILKNERFVVFNVREDLLKDLQAGKEITVHIPALDKDVKAKIYYIRDKGSYATWHATKATGDWDSRTFEIKARPTENVPGLRPGMTALYKK